MAYSTVDEVKRLLNPSVLANLTDDTGAGVIDETKVTDAIAQADAEIDGYVSVVLTTPLEPVPLLIKTISAQIAIWRLYMRQEHPNAAWESVYKNAIKMLANIAEGRLTFGPAPGAIAPAPQSVSVASKPALMSGQGGLLEGF